MAILRSSRINCLLDESVTPTEGYVATWEAASGCFKAKAPTGGAGGPHATSHQNNGGDEINVTGLSGLLADPQTPASHTHTAEIDAAIAAHAGAADPHPTYTTAAEAAAAASSAVAAHESSPDPHAGYQRESEKGAANGYASLDATGVVPASQLPASSGGGNGYVINVMAGNLATVADNATYYFGCLAALAPQTTAQLARIYIPKAGTIKVAEIWARTATAGTAENWSAYIRKNNSADTLIQTIAVGATTRRWTNTALALAVALGDFVEIKLICPTWVTNPATLALGGTLYIE